MIELPLRLALSYDDVLLIPARSSVIPGDVDTGTRIARDIELRIPLMSAAMDTVTEHRMAIAMARFGGLGVIHKNVSPAAQADEINAVKAAETEDDDGARPALDAQGRLRVAAAVGVGESRHKRIELLVRAGVDAVCIDTAHGHSEAVLRAVHNTRKEFPDLAIIAGNVATPEATLDLIAAGADAVKVGVGPGSICTTRVVAGVGVPQFSAVLECAAAAASQEIPVIADGGIKLSGDIAKALAAGAAVVMVGSLLAGTEEAPGEIVRVGSQRFKVYRGMGSLGAMGAGSAERYFQTSTAGKLVPEGVTGRVPFKGPVLDVVYQLIGGLRSAMGYLGCPTLPDLAAKAQAVRITSAGLRESHVHDVIITENTPNYPFG